ncbi:hypothetical protein CH380_03595 [Leptospira adleri]|uniref:Uncharacterized protein n=1 Tax=Leptospira adleri TaxID=2023186 RepID=A0A2M9YTE9_9LEPT|nr:hypothetical protein CH380_03595 [Leptospira adleri]PJZ59989.1 hypothetical protein CH376_20715 [Leptospira adleri]
MFRKKFFFLNSFYSSRFESVSGSNRFFFLSNIKMHLISIEIISKFFRKNRQGEPSRSFLNRRKI